MEVVQIYIASVIIYHLTVVSRPDSWLTKSKGFLFHFLRKRGKPACDALCLLTTTSKGWARDAMANDTQTRTEAKTPLALTGG